MRFVEEGLHQILVCTQRGETETRLLGNRSPLSCDSVEECVGGGVMALLLVVGAKGGHCDSGMIPSKSSFILPDEEEMALPEGALMSPACQTR